MQPQTRAHRHDRGGFDLGPAFSAEPFAGVRVMRAIVEPFDWTAVVDRLADGVIETPFARCTAAGQDWTPTVLLSQHGTSPAHAVVVGARRPVTGVVATIDGPEIPATEDDWAWATPPHLRPGPDLGAIYPHRHLLHWPIALLGIDWLGHPDHPPPARFVVGRTHHDAWIADVAPDYETRPSS